MAASSSEGTRLCAWHPGRLLSCLLVPVGVAVGGERAGSRPACTGGSEEGRKQRLLGDRESSEYPDNEAKCSLSKLFYF